MTSLLLREVASGSPPPPRSSPHPRPILPCPRPSPREQGVAGGGLRGCGPWRVRGALDPPKAAAGRSCLGAQRAEPLGGRPGVGSEVGQCSPPPGGHWRSQQQVWPAAHPIAVPFQGERGPWGALSPRVRPSPCWRAASDGHDPALRPGLCLGLTLVGRSHPLGLQLAPGAVTGAQPALPEPESSPPPHRCRLCRLACL